MKLQQVQSKMFRVATMAINWAVIVFAMLDLVGNAVNSDHFTSTVPGTESKLRFLNTIVKKFQIIMSLTELFTFVRVGKAVKKKTAKFSTRQLMIKPAAGHGSPRPGIQSLLAIMSSGSKFI